MSPLFATKGDRSESSGPDQNHRQYPLEPKEEFDGDIGAAFAD
jgi:hypothetical protein